MYPILSDLRVIEGASFIAAPSCALHLLQMGAEVIRFDQIGGGPDFYRWPRSDTGASLYWEALNKGKKSIALDLTAAEGREIAASLVTAPGKGSGLFVTNYPAEGFLSHDRLKQQRSDLVTLRVMGWTDGRTAIDYTVNAALGLPLMTGPASLGEEPVNHVLPAWDLLTGAYGAFAVLAAERYRRTTGIGQEVRLPLGDVAMAAIANIGLVGEASAAEADRQRLGNELFGAFGRDFLLRDNQRVMIAAITKRQWLGLIQALGLEPEIAELEARFGISFRDDEGVRFNYRGDLYPVFERALLDRDLGDVAPLFDRLGVCWSVYRTVRQALGDQTLLHEANPIFASVHQPSGRTYLTSGSPATFPDMRREQPQRAPLLGEHTDQVLSEVLGIPDHAIAMLHDRSVVAGP